MLPIAFSLFHYPNMQDNTFAVLTGEPPVWDENWQSRVQMAIDDHGKERTVDEMIHQRVGDYEPCSTPSGAGGTSTACGTGARSSSSVAWSASAA